MVLNIVKTLIYFKVRGIGLTLVKVQRLLLNLKDTNLPTISLFKLRKILNWLQKEGAVKENDGIYQWDDDSTKTMMNSSVEQGKIVAEKMKIAVRATKILELIPFIKLIGVCGTVATGNPRESSDVDLFIVTKKGRIWLTRLGIMLLLEIFGLRKKKYKKAGRICLNHFIAEDSLELKFKDLYTAMEFVSMICLLDRDNTLQKFKLKNSWIEEYLPNAEWQETKIYNYWQKKIQGQKLNIETGFQPIIETSLKPVSMINLLEGLARIFQERRIKQKRKREKGGQVYWGEDALIFHPKPKSILFRTLYQQKLVEQKQVIQELLGSL